MNRLGTKELETDRLLLRRFVSEDCFAMYHNWAKLEKCARYFPWNPVSDIETLRKRLENWINGYDSDLYFQWGIELKDSHELVGVINLHNVEEEYNSAETSYILTPRCWNEGYMTECLERVLSFAFRELGLNRISADYLWGNEASAKVMKKNHMSFEGISREKYYKNGLYIDSVQYAVLKKDWDSGFHCIETVHMV